MSSKAFEAIFKNYSFVNGLALPENNGWPLLLQQLVLYSAALIDGKRFD